MGQGKLGRFMLFGSLIGGTIALFDRTTRKNLAQGMGKLKNNTVSMYQTVKNNPRQLSEQCRNTAANIRLAAEEVSEDVKEMVDKMDGVRRSSSEAYRFAMEAGDEITQIRQKIMTAGKGKPMAQLPATTQTFDAMHQTESNQQF